MKNYWVVVPTYNERANLTELVRRVFAAVPEWHTLVVDDNSPDNTGALADELALFHPRLHVLHRTTKAGLGSAYRAGFVYALEHGADTVGEMDADLSHKPEDLPKLQGVLEAGADIAIGSRRVPGGAVQGWNWQRKLMSWGASTMTRLALGLHTRDVTAGFRLYTKNALGQVPWQATYSNGYAWQEEMLFLCERARLKVVEVPIVFTDRVAGKSKLGWKDIRGLVATIVQLKCKR